MRILTIVIFLLSANLTLYGQGGLEKSKSEVKENKNKSESNSESSSSSRSDTASPFIAQLVYYVSWGLFVGVYQTEDHLHNTLTRYPYNNDHRGDYMWTSNLEERKTFRLDIGNQILIGDNMYGNHLKLKLRPSRYFYFQGDYTELIEPRVDQGYDHLSLFNINVSYDRIRTRSLSLGWTVGVSYIGNEVQQAGFNIGLQMEYFLPFKTSLYSAIKGGEINGSAISEFEVSARIHFSRLYGSFGYERVRIATPIFHFASVGLGLYL